MHGNGCGDSTVAAGRADGLAGGRGAGRNGRWGWRGPANCGGGQCRLDGDGVFTVVDDVLFDVRIEDQDHSARLLREGVVMGAVTTERHPVPGCRVQPLGVMRYEPVASPSYMKQYLPDGFTAHAAAEAPSLAWNRDDALQDMLVRKVFRRDIVRPVHFVPTAEGFGAAVRAGLGWGSAFFTGWISRRRGIGA